ncbi:tumor necrosis factor receptor superfamily member 8 isoform X2 [Diceros bicornis minor]|uniref:tumor necrosis factor receptor superfamily member 8 isoform X2 n=1 Tax=Diceros bicornis minor TaxID=77932 RepID=UPI0026EC6259|nr:tumor necrosis factor receptor superfamily member 8 isoform X2 [Diceros bicornis minor]
MWQPWNPSPSHHPPTLYCFSHPPGDVRQGLSPQQPCPKVVSDCRKQCEEDYYLNGDGRCTACVSCSGDLVEKKPCSWNSSRVCECQAGMFCATSATNSCARCSPHSACPAGMIVKLPGTAERDTVCEPSSPGTSPDCSTSPEDCRAPARRIDSPISGSPPSGTTPQAKPRLTSPASSHARTMLLGGGTSEEDSKATRAPSFSFSAGKPSPDPGPTPQQPCPQGSPDCRKQCERDYYLNGDGRCMACVSCSGDDLVEKTPCTWNSSRVCECRPGMFCATSATNSCARCIAHPICPPGMVTKLQGAAEWDATDEPPPAGSHPNCSTNPEDREASASSTPSLADPQTSQGHGGGITHARGDASILTSAPISFSSTGKPMLVSGPVLFWVILTLVVVVSSGSFLLCHRKACRRWIRQKLHLCYPARTFRPKLEPGLVDSKPRRNSPELKRSVLVAEPGTEELGLMSSPAVETCPSVGAACLESQRLLQASPPSRTSSPVDLPEPRVTTEHTNNRIEKIYIMKADTVIVGSVKTEVPEGRGLMGPAGPEFEEDLEVDHAPHYPEQETEPPLGSCGDVMFSVEEEGKEDPLPTTASGK